MLWHWDVHCLGRDVPRITTTIMSTRMPKGSRYTITTTMA